MSALTKTLVVTNMLQDPLFRYVTYDPPITPVWNCGSGWTISSPGLAECILSSPGSSNLSQPGLTFVSGQTYKVLYTVKPAQATEGTLTVEFYDGSNVVRGSATLQNASGAHENTVTLSGDAQNIRFVLNSTGRGYTRLDNVSVSLNDQYTSIHSAVAALGASGGAIIVEGGHYPVPLDTSMTTIVVPSNCSIMGHGPVGVIIEDDIPAFQNSDQNNGNNGISISGLAFIIGLGTSYTSNVVNMKRVKNCLFERLSVYCETGSPSADKAAILIEGNGADDPNCYGNTVSKCLLSHTGYGIHLKYSAENILADNTVKPCQTAGIFLESSPKNIVSGNSISDNGSTYDQPQYAGIRVLSSDYTIIQENRVIGNYNVGIRIDQSSNCAIAGNVCNSNFFEGILVAGSATVAADYNVLSGNICQNNGKVAAQQFQKAGVHIGYYARYNTINGNNCHGNDLHGIEERNDSSTGDNLYVGNMCYSNGGDDLYVLGLSSIVINNMSE